MKAMENGGRAPKAADFGTLLRRYRLAAGLSQEALAERARMSVNGIGVLERGDRRTPQRETLPLLADALALSGENAGSSRRPRAVQLAAAEAGLGHGGPWPETASQIFRLR